MCKPSKYNIYLTYKDRYYIFNQLSSELREVDLELYDELQNTTGQIQLTDPDLISDLLKCNILSHFDCDEVNKILCANKIYRFLNSTARVTIIPTLECNFRCWYCYETHESGHMSTPDVDSVITFCKNLIAKGGLKSFVLDWFGGEPLLYFNSIVYPISLAIKAYCKDNGVEFFNSITTNGFFATEDLIHRFNEIELRGFQITLDGERRYHDKTRYNANRCGSYDVIVSNITRLCRDIEGISMTLRINYTPANLKTLEAIADSFPKDIRKKIFIEPQLVWQYKESVNTITDTLAHKLMYFQSLGYTTRGNVLPETCRWCYAESMNQFVINFDLSVFKCTARDFTNPIYSIGNISKDGVFVPNDNYYKYFISSFFENETCLDCNVLPSCTGMCIQKKIENSIPRCPKENIMESIQNKLKSIIDFSN